jgi:hypothetical protein
MVDLHLNAGDIKTVIDHKTSGETLGYTIFRACVQPGIRGRIILIQLGAAHKHSYIDTADRSGTCLVSPDCVYNSPPSTNPIPLTVKPTGYNMVFGGSSDVYAV